MSATAAGRPIGRARWGTATVFAVHGAVTGSFAARLPWVAAHVGVGAGRLGVALLMPGVGAMLAMPFSGRLAHRYSFRPLVAVTIAAWCASLILPALATSLVLLCGALLVYGAAAGLADMAMNAHGALVERRIGRSVMSSFHGLWSVGVLLGSAVSALAARVGLDARLEFLAVAGALIAIGVAASRALVDDPAPEDGAEPPHFALPTRPVVVIGLIGLCAVFGELAGMDWSAFFLRHELRASASTAALAVTVVSATMATARLVGDRVIRVLGATRTVRLSAACAASGTGVVLWAPTLGAALGGFALLGIGVAVVVPLVFAAAGRIGPHPARSIAGVAGIAYGSGLLAPGTIGAVASVSSLRVSFGVVGGLLVAMGLAAGALRGHSPLPDVAPLASGPV